MNEPRRRSLRLKGWDYAGDAWYFVTICCDGRRKLFGEVVTESGVPISEVDPSTDISIIACGVALSEAGRCCDQALASAMTPAKQMCITEYVVMPNHVHFVVRAKQGEEAPTSLDSFVHFVKSSVTRMVRKRQPGATVWQKGYFEHIIRDEADYQRIAEYIANNPAKWADDRYFA